MARSGSDLMSPERPTARQTAAAKPVAVSAELKALMRRLKLGRLLDTLPERLALAQTQHLPHHDFLELLLADEVTRRDRQAALVRAKRAHLDPSMQLEAWDESTPVTLDRALWAELTSLRFLADAYNVLVMGPVRVGKTFLATALGHIAVRRAHTVHAERADKLFTVRHRTKITKGPGSRAAGLAMAFKLIEAAQDRWRAVNAPHLVALVRAGATFVNGKLVERPDEHHEPEAA